MDIVVTGRHQHISDEFRDRVNEKLSKVPSLAPRMRRIDVVLSHEANKGQGKSCERVEITCRDKGPVVRAEACLEDKYAALDAVTDKLMERLRRAHDRRQVHRRGGRAAESVAEATARILPELAHPVSGDEAAHDDTPAQPFGAVGDSPIEVREKVHESAPMTLEDAVQEMELVGHDFYLFHDAETGKPSVVYRRRGWSYGVIHLELRESAMADEPDHQQIAV